MQPITYGCFYYVLKNNPLYKVLPIVTMGIPLTGLLAAIFLLGEKPTLELFIGGLSGNEISIGKPIISNDEIKQMYPNEARLKGLTYGAHIFCDITVQFISSNIWFIY